jgi:flagellar motility protein MotE (MotC chaperone)
MNLTKLQRCVSAVRPARLAQAVMALVVIKLTAVFFLWMPEPAPQQESIVRPVIVRQALAASPALAEEKPAQTEKTEVPPAPVPDKSISAREQEVRKREAELKSMEAEIDAKLENLRAMELKMEKLLESAGAVQDEKMQHLVDVYSNMKPKQAAQVLENLDESIAVKILAGMSGRKAGEILSFVRTERTAKLSEALTRLQTGN